MSQTPLVAVIDDDDGMRRSVEGLVRSCGYRAEMFGSGEAFMAAQHSASFDCIISDIQMPGGMSGTELVDLLHRQGRSTPVILISAYVNEKVSGEVAAVRAYGLLRKPFDGDLLIDVLDRAIAA